MIEFDNVKIFTDRIESSALEQLHTLCKSGIFDGQPIRIMPDVHAGAGCVIGFTVPFKDKIVPNLVGVDISCGMLCVPLGNVTPDFAKVDEVIKRRIPAGMKTGDFSPEARDIFDRLRCRDKIRNRERIEASLGTLGGGNHFIEIDSDGKGGYYLIVHSGSRNLGVQVAEFYQKIAKTERKEKRTAAVIEKCKAEGRLKDISASLIRLKDDPLPQELNYLEGESMRDYLFDAALCGEYADLSRKKMAAVILEECFPDADLAGGFTTLHNYIGADGYIRKGAISARKGQKVLIPLNMRDGCIVGTGKGNPDWNYSAPHGAGRIMSRAAARANINLNDYVKSMQGIYSTTVNSETIDEAPSAYKPADEIVELVKDTVKVDKRIYPVYNFKAAE